MELKDIIQMLDTNIALFKNMGGDIEKFITNLKLIHAKRIFSLDDNHRKVLNKDDFANAIEFMKQNQFVKPAINHAVNLYI